MIFTISATQKASLEKVFDVLIPSVEKEKDELDFWKRKASDRNVVEKALELIGNLKIEDQNDLKTAFSLLDSSFLGVTWFGTMKPARNLDEKQIAKMLQKWSIHPIADIRNLFNTLKKLCGIIYFGDTQKGEQNPNWAAIKYELSIKEKPTNSNKFNVLEIEKSTVLECDVVVVGSGSGGSIVAAELARKGKKVIIVEKGNYLQETDFNQHELDMIQKTYEGQGLITSKSGSISILAGSNVGGGTTINWAGSLRTPDYVLKQWAAEFNNPQFIDNQYLKGFEYVEKRNNVNTDIQHNIQNQLLWEAAKKKNLSAEIIPQNVKKPPHISDETFWKAQGFSCLGDTYGAKQSASKTFLQDASDFGAEILPNTYINKITVKNGEAIGVEGMCKGFSIQILAKKVVISSGALHTPALLLRSGLRHAEIGKNLFLHPVVPVVGRYDTVVNPWFGPMMTTIVKDFAQLDGNYGFRMECPPVHPGLAAVIMSWESGEKFKDEILNLRHAGISFGLVRDKFGGQVKLSPKSKQPEVHYTLHDYDKNHLLKGFEEVVKLQVAAGAKRISIPHNQQLHFFPEQEKTSDFIARFQKLPWKTNYFGVYSAHQMGTVRMGGKANCPVKPNGETREVKNLFVADTSLFPSASGANPMLSAQALSYYVSQFVL
jgi:choline dehydrogenase-like flavoprotein